MVCIFLQKVGSHDVLRDLIGSECRRAWPTHYCKQIIYKETKIRQSNMFIDYRPLSSDDSYRRPGLDNTSPLMRQKSRPQLVRTRLPEASAIG
jgi:hypothetical protein